MNKERQVIKPGTIVFFNRNVKGEELEGLSDKSLTVVINGDLLLESDFNFKGDLYVESIRGKYDICIDGNLTCNEEVNTYDILVARDFTTYEYVKANNIFVGGDFYSKVGMDTLDITVEGCFWTEELEASSVCVGGDFRCESIESSGFKIDVAGDFECKDAVYARTVNVLGRVHVDGPIDADEIKIGY